MIETRTHNLESLDFDGEIVVKRLAIGPHGQMITDIWKKIIYFSFFGAESDRAISGCPAFHEPEQ